MNQIYQMAILVLCSIILVPFAVGQCDNNSECVSFKSCAFYKEATSLLTPELKQKLRTLLCGFQHGDTKICCPGELVQRNDVKNKNQLPPIEDCYTEIDYPSRNFTDLIEHAWTILLRFKEPSEMSSFHCGGVLISSQYALTAAHCVLNRTNRANSTLTLRLGEWDLSKETDCIYVDCNNPAQDISVEEIIPHESRDSFQSDIALLRLSKNVELSDSVKPICLLQEELPELFFNDYEVVVAGWGKTLDSNGTDLKFKGYVSVVDNKECEDLLAKVKQEISDRHFCVKGNFCAADSGSGLMIATLAARRSYAAKLYGIESFRSVDCKNGTAVYTRVDAYKGWILKQLRP